MGKYSRLKQIQGFVLKMPVALFWVIISFLNNLLHNPAFPGGETGFCKAALYITVPVPTQLPPPPRPFSAPLRHSQGLMLYSAFWPAIPFATDEALTPVTALHPASPHSTVNFKHFDLFIFLFIYLFFCVFAFISRHLWQGLI